MILPRQPNFLERRRLGPGLSLLKSTDLDHRDQPVAGQGILGHLAVTGLENMEWKDDVRERDEVGQREQPGDLAKSPASRNRDPYPSIVSPDCHSRIASGRVAEREPAA